MVSVHRIAAVCLIALSTGACLPETRQAAFASLGDMTLFGPSLPPEYQRQTVRNTTGEKPGTVVVDTKRRFLYLVQSDGTALRYGVGVGREGFAWSGSARVGRKQEWPDWRPPPAMLARRPDLPRFMEGGRDNPLGARALYLYDGGRDTMFRIHGSNEPWTIGQAVSSGCIRMTNQDVAHLYERVPVGARVVVR